PVAPLVAEHAPVGVPSRLPASRRPYLRAPRDFAAPVPTAALPDPLGREAAARTETPLRRLSDSNAEESRADSTLHPLVKEATAGTSPVKAKAQRKASASTARASGPRASAGPKGPVFSHRPRAQPRREAPLDDLASLIEPPSPTIQKVSLQSP
ncbi:MAG TPA: hypothetical protein VFV47_03220, partial [Hyphomicrobiaceae bacterium]|nr:hypothetical protein [Hyphomicrobiaceae bacterium]